MKHDLSSEKFGDVDEDHFAVETAFLRGVDVHDVDFLGDGQVAKFHDGLQEHPDFE
ncbi:hypothetical protein [Listeria cornellensis]|uniref:hypothetical protein n=1 Tax=Listeria cornellensis TaxID=1494961 RepID=UPI0004AF5924|nr:hypothetical protein [Listeria cornellensis]